MQYVGTTPVGDSPTSERRACAYCRTAQPTTYYAISRGKLIRHWLCVECADDARDKGWSVTSLPCAECRVPSTRHSNAHAFVPVGFGR